MRPWLPLFLIAGAFVGLCLAFIEATPYRKSGVLLNQRDGRGNPLPAADIGAPDERQHANYVSSLLGGEGFPVLKPGSADLYETYQAHQPPLYYLLAAGWCKALGLDPKRREDGGRLRVLNVVVGLATLLGVYYGALWGAGREETGLAAAAVLLMPMLVALHSAVGNDPLLFALTTWATALAIRGATQGWTRGRAVGVGILTGLALLTKTTAVALLPTAVVALLVAARSGGRGDGKAWAAALGLPLAMAAPWWWRNARLYGDPLALRAFNEAFAGSPQASTYIEALGANVYWQNMVAWWTGRSLVGVFGYLDVFLFETMGRDRSDALYAAILVVLGTLAAVGFVTWALPSEGKGSGRERPWRAGVVGLTLSGVVLFLFVRFNAQYFQGQARYLYPAVGPIAWTLAAGAVRAMGRVKGWAWLALLALLGGLSLYGAQTLEASFAPRVLDENAPRLQSVSSIRKGHDDRDAEPEPPLAGSTAGGPGSRARPHGRARPRRSPAP